jgi:phospholipid transport system substrate-binding protein
MTGEPFSSPQPAQAMKNLFITLCLSLFAAAVSAQERVPAMEMTKITNEVIEIIKQDQGGHAGKKVNALVEAKVLPHFDFGGMTALAMGRNWSKANAEQQKALTNEFRTLFVHAYSSALSVYRDQVIDFKPLPAAAGDTTVTIRTQFKQPGVELINIDYDMQKTARGWKVHEVVVAGVSLAANYRETFDAEIRGAGVDGLIKTLASKNRSLETQPGSKPN